MKKIVAMLLCLSLALTFTACGKKDTSSDSDKVDIEYLAKHGEIPECSYSLGYDVDKLADELSKAAQEDDNKSYNMTEGTLSVLLDSGDFLYYYTKENKSKGVSYIVDYGKAYGFDIGTVSVEIKNKLADYTPVEEELSEKNAFFASFSEGSVLKYTFGKNVVIFVFQDNALCATALYNTDNWNL